MTDRIVSYTKPIIDNPNEIYNKLININITDREGRKEHVQYDKNARKSINYNDLTLCPWCGCVYYKLSYNDYILLCNSIWNSCFK